MGEDTVERELFGGAMRMAIPPRFQDVSDFRPVPDHQEVWADGEADQSVIVEVVEHNAEVANERLAAWVYEDLAAANEASSSSLDSTRVLAADELPGLPGDAFKCMADGHMRASKGRGPEAAEHDVHVLLAAVRLPSVGADVLVTLNTPQHAATSAGAGALFAMLLRSLAIVDYGIFEG